MNDLHNSETPRYSIVEAYRDKLMTANMSWSETDKLYVSVCSVLISAAVIFVGNTPDPPISITLIGVLLLYLVQNWSHLIDRYREKIGSALQGLSEQQGDDNNEMGNHFRQEKERFSADLSDYRIVKTIRWLAVFLIVYPGGYRMSTYFWNFLHVSCDL